MTGEVKYILSEPALLKNLTRTSGKRGLSAELLAAC